MAATTTRLTIDDFERLPLDQVKNHELIDGELVPVSGNILRNNKIRDVLVRHLGDFVDERRLGSVVGEQEYDFEGNAHGPDVTFYGQSKQPLADPNKRVQRFVPDLAVEVVSPNDTWASLMRKKERYRRCGTAEVWIVSPEDCKVYVFSSGGDRILSEGVELTSDLLPGFRLPVARLFEEPAAG